MRAKVIFTDGFHVSITIETNSKDLEVRIAKAVHPGGSPARVATLFLMQSLLHFESSTALNTPAGRTFGGTMTMIQNEAFWPGGGDQAGVFLVMVDSCVVQFWGGNGFDDSEEFTKAIPQERKLVMGDKDAKD